MLVSRSRRTARRCGGGRGRGDPVQWVGGVHHPRVRPRLSSPPCSAATVLVGLSLGIWVGRAADARDGIPADAAEAPRLPTAARGGRNGGCDRRLDRGLEPGGHRRPPGRCRPRSRSSSRGSCSPSCGGSSTARPDRSPGHRRWSSALTAAAARPSPGRAVTGADDLRRADRRARPGRQGHPRGVRSASLVAIALEALVALDRIVDPRRAARRGLALLVTVGGAIVASLPMTAAIAGLWVRARPPRPAVRSPTGGPSTGWSSWSCASWPWDLAAYAYHRVGHRTRVGWASHRVHHLGQTYDMSLVLRQPWFPVHGLVVLPWLALAGFSFEAAAVSSALSIGYQALQHTSRRVALAGAARGGARVGPGPSPPPPRRRWRGQPRRRADSVWDRLFGTHVVGPVSAPVPSRRRGRDSPEFGVGAPEPLNPVRIQLDGWLLAEASDAHRYRARRRPTMAQYVTRA